MNILRFGGKKLFYSQLKMCKTQRVIHNFLFWIAKKGIGCSLASSHNLQIWLIFFMF